MSEFEQRASGLVTPKEPPKPTQLFLHVCRSLHAVRDTVWRIGAGRVLGVLQDTKKPKPTHGIVLGNQWIVVYRAEEPVEIEEHT